MTACPSQCVFGGGVSTLSRDLTDVSPFVFPGFL